jgi:PhoH-like ATPase
VQRCASSIQAREVVLVSKDINMRVKARALGLAAEDYFNDKTLEDGDLLYTGVLPLPADFWERHGKTMESWQQGGHTFYRISRPDGAGADGQPVRLPRDAGRRAAVRPRHRDHRQDRVLKTLSDYTHQKNASGASPRATASRTSRSTC